jgi:GTPase SAR1 family protein
MSIIQYDESNPINFNLVKEGLVDALVSEKFLTPEQGDTIKKNYSITIVKKNWLGRLVDSLLWSKDSKDEYKMVVVKVVFPPR